MISKLDSVLISLDKRDSKAITNKLSAFIDYVNVQRKKKIDPVKADSLIEAAQRILENIE